MATDVKINLETLDFEDSPDGGWVEVDDSSTAVVCQLESEEGAWWGDPPAGSKNREMMRSGDPVQPEDLVDSSRRAMLAMVRAGAISDLTVKVGRRNDEHGLAEIDLFWRDRATNKPADLAYSPLGGHP